MTNREQLELDVGARPSSAPHPLVQEDMPPSAVMYRLGGRLYPVKSEPRCSTCQSPHRLHVERQLIRGYSYSAIVRDLPDDAGLTSRGIALHVQKNHLPLNEHVKRVAIEERARELGRDAERHEQSLVDAITFARLGIQDVFERMQNGELKPSVKDGIQFARLLHEVGLAERDEVGVEATREMFAAYMDAFVAVVDDPEQQQRFANALNAHPTMRAWLADYHGHSSSQTEVIELVEGDIEDAELVEDGESDH